MLWDDGTRYTSIDDSRCNGSCQLGMGVVIENGLSSQSVLVIYPQG